jgi:spore coat protein U-like protein
MLGVNGSLLHYSLFSDPSLTQILGSGSPGIQLGTGPMAFLHTTPLNFGLFGRIAPLQNVRAGSYSDNVMITVTP